MHEVLSLFTGGGGLDLGLHGTGRFWLRACVDASAACCETILLNRRAGRIGGPGLRVYQSDVRRLDPGTLLSDLGLRPGDLSTLAGAPPCQSFSTAGRRRGVAEPRGRLIWDFLRFVDAIRPCTFLFENVEGLMQAALRPRPKGQRPEDGGPPLEADERPETLIRSILGGLPTGYRADCFLVNAANYGCPQIRERVIVVGNRFGRLAEFPTPTHGGPGQPPFRTLGEALANLADPAPVVMPFRPVVAELMNQIEEGRNWRSLPAGLAAEAMGNAYYRCSGGRSRYFRRLSRNLPCLTVLTAPNSMFTPLNHPTVARPLSLRECGRVQQFPDDWEFAGSTDERFAQVGNAVPPDSLGRACGEAVAGLLDAIERGGREEGNPPWRIVYLRPRVRIQWP